MLKSFRYLLFPFSLLFGAAVWLRNWLYDKRVLKSSAFNFPLICVGNLAVGGTGKTPMTEYIVELLKNDFETATLSRGYKRKTKGFAIANAASTAIEIGDEPMQLHEKFPGITVAVGEERLVAIPHLLHDRPGTEVIILDDAFQHRTVRAGMNVLLTEYANRYSRDFMLPAGDLRDIRSSAKRAEIIVVTKCPAELSLTESAAIRDELKPLAHQRVFFTQMLYAQPYSLFDGNKKADIGSATDVLLVTGIANPEPLKNFLGKHVHRYDMLAYADHHIFKTEDLREILRQFGKLPAENRMIITTEKDAVRLRKFKELESHPVYVLPVRHGFLLNGETEFHETLVNYCRGFERVTA